MPAQTQAQYAGIHKSLADLTPDPRNANRGTQRGQEMIASSLRKYGAGRSILLDKHGAIIAGNKTFENAGSLGMDDVIVVPTDGTKLVAVQRMDLDLADAKTREMAIADNRAGQVSLDWDIDVLKELSTEIDLAPFWSADELEAMWPQNADLLTDEDAVPDLPEEAVTKPGDLYILGRHRLLCGDSTVREDVLALLAGEQADMVFTDPPYNHASDDKGVAASVSKAHRDLMASEWDKGFRFQDVAERLDEAIATNCTVYICTSWHLAGEIWAWMAKRSSHYSYCVWHKPNPMPSLMKRHWTWASELICYATFGKHTFNFPAEGHAPNVWNITKQSDGSHPTQKPVALVEHALSHSSRKADIVLDLFGGSGTTLMACEKTGRAARLMEIDPRYCDVIVQRWQDATGQKAVLDGTAA